MATLRGTADITVHEKQEDGKLKELCQATGDACGGTSIDNEFFQIMVKICGEPLMNSLSWKDPLAYLDLFREFETVKRTVHHNKTGKMNFTVPYAALNDLCRVNFGEDFPATVKSCSLSDKISLRGDKMRAEVDVVKALYSKSSIDIISQITNVIKQCEGVSMLLLVGGFSESDMLQHVIQKEFPDKRIIIPEDAGLSVLKGAVLFGQNPGYIASRVMRYTYGIQVKNKFNKNIHDKAKLEIIDGEEKCKNCFNIVKKLNEDASPGTIVKQEFKTVKFQKALAVIVFVSKKEDPMYTDEPGCMQIGTFRVKIHNPSEKIRRFDVEFHFGNTELTINTTERGTGHSETAMFDLM
ncbi:Hypothetical predicted protein [Mytilus galloprovincialis]|uniref:Uncharacterized protein n=1 Tax=Mytilus galloprovincialis TaxID=29158 RepID=A0A8B6ETV6_MYTGA|nr:Hypothetical predicted protein [Mytilus galloprovincialis]